MQYCFVASFDTMFRGFQLVAQQNFLLILCCRLKEVVAKSRARVYLEQQILALLLVFHQTYNLSRNKFAHAARQVEGVCISHFSPPLLSCGSLADCLLQLSFILALLWLNWIQRGFSVSLFWLLFVRGRRLDLARRPNFAHCRDLHGGRVLFWLTGRLLSLLAR